MSEPRGAPPPCGPPIEPPPCGPPIEPPPGDPPLAVWERAWLTSCSAPAVSPRPSAWRACSVACCCGLLTAPPGSAGLDRVIQECGLGALERLLRGARPVLAESTLRIPQVGIRRGVLAATRRRQSWGDVRVGVAPVDIAGSRRRGLGTRQHRAHARGGFPSQSCRYDHAGDDAPCPHAGCWPCRSPKSRSSRRSWIALRASHTARVLRPCWWERLSRHCPDKSDSPPVWLRRVPTLAGRAGRHAVGGLRGLLAALAGRRSLCRLHRARRLGESRRGDGHPEQGR